MELCVKVWRSFKNFITRKLVSVGDKKITFCFMNQFPFSFLTHLFPEPGYNRFKPTNGRIFELGFQIMVEEIFKVWKLPENLVVSIFDNYYVLGEVGLKVFICFRYQMRTSVSTACLDSGSLGRTTEFLSMTQTLSIITTWIQACLITFGRLKTKSTSSTQKRALLWPVLFSTEQLLEYQEIKKVDGLSMLAIQSDQRSLVPWISNGFPLTPSIAIWPWWQWRQTSAWSIGCPWKSKCNRIFLPLDEVILSK